MNTIFEKIYLTGIVPVINLKSIDDGVNLAKAMLEGGLPVIEVAFRSQGAADALRAIRMTYPEMTAGAGTILTRKQVDQAKDAGAMFVVSPGYDDDIVAYCQQLDIPVVPGVTNSTDIQKGIRAGLDVFKFFPAEPSGGLETIDYLAAPFGQVKFIPAGGISFDNLADYLTNEHIIACAGGFVARESHIVNGEWNAITELCQKAIKAALDFKFAHIGVNFENEEKTLQAADWFKTTFNINSIVGNSSVFASSSLELMKFPYLGKNGHIAFSTTSVERAINWLEYHGQKIINESIRFDAKGCMQSAYLSDELGGFAIHIVKVKK